MREFGETCNGASDLVLVQVAGGDVLLLVAKVEVIFPAPCELQVSVRGPVSVQGPCLGGGSVEGNDRGARGLSGVLYICVNVVVLYIHVPHPLVRKVIEAIGFVEEGSHMLTDDGVAADCLQAIEAGGSVQKMDLRQKILGAKGGEGFGGQAKGLEGGKREPTNYVSLDLNGEKMSP